MQKRKNLVPCYDKQHRFEKERKNYTLIDYLATARYYICHAFTPRRWKPATGAALLAQLPPSLPVSSWFLCGAGIRFWKKAGSTFEIVEWLLCVHGPGDHALSLILCPRATKRLSTGVNFERMSKPVQVNGAGAWAQHRVLACASWWTGALRINPREERWHVVTLWPLEGLGSKSFFLITLVLLSLEELQQQQTPAGLQERFVKPKRF